MSQVSSPSESHPKSVTRVPLPGIEGFYRAAAGLPEEDWNFNLPTRRCLPSIDLYIPHIEPDKDEFFEFLLWEQIRGKSLRHWIRLYFERDPGRVPYASEECNTGKTKDSTVIDWESLDEEDKKKALANKHHQRLERERRARQREMMKVVDTYCSESDFKLAKQTTPAILQWFGHLPPSRPEKLPKATGKDDVFVATIFHVILGKWIIRELLQWAGELAAIQFSLPSLLTATECTTPVADNKSTMTIRQAPRRQGPHL